ncbi:rho GTPase-activating protein 190 isoform X17 [Parasteatoda tepidariorum]|uniref:rho GTPase-activating protein 190 isoform X17 n=1 Tax=Parasteatoda tepidariorum TaxID=114398 RepID=UPI0039BD27B1
MARKSETQRSFNIAVVGLSGTEKEKGSTGVGKSCLCNRFIRSLADDYYTDHISVLSQTDFSGRVVNNDHFLYWGEVSKLSEEGIDFNFHVIEQTEFIDDSSFQPFKSGKTDPYYKRCSATKLTSAEKLMYICKNQLGIEKEYEQKLLPDGKINVDGFVCVFDVSEVQGRSIEKQVEFTALILNNLMKTKKPIVLATTKNDEAKEMYVKEAERLVSRKEFKNNIPIVETSSHENVNVDLTFIITAQMIDRTKGKAKLVPFFDSARSRKEVLDFCTESYQSLIRAQVTDYRALWSSVSKKFAQNQDFIHYCELFGHDAAQKMFRRHVKKLKEEYIGRKMQMYIRILPEVFGELLPDLASIGDGGWENVRIKLQQHPDFSQYFLESPDEMPWQESDLVDSNETRIPLDILDTAEAEACFEEHKAALEAEERRKEMRQQFKELLEETGYVTPGKPLSEVQVLFMGRECYEALSEPDLLEIYDEHQREITEKAKQNFQELLLENAEIFYHFTSIGPGSVITQEDINKITEKLQEDLRYKTLDRLDQDRMLMLLRHLGFVHGPIREHCPASLKCMDSLVEKVIAQKAHRPPSWQRNSHWLLENNQLNLVLLGSGGLADELANIIKTQCTDDMFEVDKIQYTLDFRIIDGDVGLPQNSFRTSDFLPHGCFCVYSNHTTLEYIRDSLEKTLLSNLEQEDRLPFHGLPIVILFAADDSINEKDLIFLREEGQNRAKSLQCPFLDVSCADDSPEQRFDVTSLVQALQSLIESIQRRAGLLQIYHTLPEQSITSDIRIIMCMLCGDPYSVEHVLGPLLSHQCCFVTTPHTVTLETYLGESKRSVEVRVTSYHGANSYRDELVHGFILVFSTKRKASLATLSAFSMNIPNIPIQILAVTETGSANAFFSSDLSHQLITEGNAVADKLQAHFMTSSSTSQQKTAFYTPFFKEVWERKPQIEKAFSLEDSDYSIGSRTPVPPPVPSRQESYHLRSGSLEDGGDSEGLYEQLPVEAVHGPDDGSVSPTGFIDGPPLSPSDDSDLYASVFNQENGEHLVKPSQIKNRRSLHADIYHQSFPSTESLDRSVSMKSRDNNGPPPPLPPSRHDRDPNSGIDLAYPPPTLGTFTGNASPPPSYHSQVHYSPRLPPHPMPLPSSLYATGRRRPPAPERALPFPPYELKKSNSLKSCGMGMPSTPSAPSLSHPNSGQGPRIPDDLDASDSITDDDDTISSGLSGWVDNRLFGHDMRNREDWPDNEMYHTYHADRQKVPPPTKPKPGKPKPKKIDLKQYGHLTDAIGRINLTSHKSGATLPKVGLMHAPLATPESMDLGNEYAQVKDAVHLFSTDRNEYEYAVVHNALPDSKPHRIRSLTRRHGNRDTFDRGKSLCSDSESEWSSLERRQREVYSKANRKPTPHKKTRKKRGIPVAPPRIPSFEGPPPPLPPFPGGQRIVTAQSLDPLDKAKLKIEQSIPSVPPQEDDSSYEIASPRDGSTNARGKSENDKAGKKKEERKKNREDEKQEKRRIKEEERQKRLTEKKKKKGAQGKSGTINQQVQGIEDFMQSEDNPTPLFVEKCIKFIEEEGLDSEGIYRVPGNRAHVDLLFQKFDEDPSVSIRELDIPVNAVATALKDFFSKRLPPLIPPCLMNELTEISGASYSSSGIQDKSCRLFTLRDLLKKLPSCNFEVLKFVFQHFVKVADNCRLNSMDSKNLAICWWPTLLPLEFSDMMMFERMRPHLEDSVQTMIDQFRFLFCGEEEVVMV